MHSPFPAPAIHQNPGALEVICGSMFSGKTEELIRRIKRAQIARQRVQVFKPRLDNRYAAEQVASHSGLLYQAIPVDDTAEIRAPLDPEATVVAIDEVQFFDCEVADLCRELADQRRARDRRRPGPRLPRRAVRPDADADGRGRAGQQAPGDLRGLRQRRPAAPSA